MQERGQAWQCQRRYRGGWPELEGTLAAGAEPVNRSLGRGSSELQTLGRAASGVVPRSSEAPSSMPLGSGSPPLRHRVGTSWAPASELGSSGEGAWEPRLTPSKGSASVPQGSGPPPREVRLTTPEAPDTHPWGSPLTTPGAPPLWAEMAQNRSSLKKPNGIRHLFLYRPSEYAGLANPHMPMPFIVYHSGPKFRFCNDLYAPIP